MSTVIGLDPGLTGGVAFLDSSGAIGAHPMPVLAGEIDFARLCDLLRPAQIDYETKDIPHVFIERAQAFPKMGRSGAFNYGASYWGARALCAALALPYTLVSPAKWHRALCLGKDGSPKDRALRACLQLFPTTNLAVGRRTKPHEGIVDALLIAEFGRRQLRGQP